MVNGKRYSGEEVANRSEFFAPRLAPCELSRTSEAQYACGSEKKMGSPLSN